MSDTKLLEEAKVLEDSVKEKIREFFPIKGTYFTLDLQEIRFKRPAINDLAHEMSIKLNQRNLTGAVYGKFILKDANGKVLDQSKDGTPLLSIPYKTNRDTYIIGGQEKVIWNQTRLKPGVYTFHKDTEVASMFFLKRGKRIYFEFDPKTVKFTVKISTRSWDIVTFLGILGVSEGSIRTAIGNDAIADLLFKRASKTLGPQIEKLWDTLEGNILEATKRERRYPGQEEATKQIRDRIFNETDFGDTGQKVMQISLGYSSDKVTPELFLRTITKVIGVAGAKVEEDNKDDIRFQDTFSGDYFIIYKIEEGLTDFRRSVLRRLNDASKVSRKDDLTLAEVLQSGKIYSKLDEFLRKGSIVDNVEQTNPLQLISASRKLTHLGEGGLNPRSSSDETRNLQNSEFGKIDPVETPESGKIGLVNHLAQFSYVKDTTIYTKYYAVKDGVAHTDKVIDLEPFEESKVYIAFHDPNLVKYEGKTIVLPKIVRARRGGDIVDVSRDKVSYIDISPNSIFGHAVSLIPFSAHNDGNRTLMGSNMQKQALQITTREAPLVQSAVDHTKKETYEQLIGREHAFSIVSKTDGTVTKVTDNKIVVKDVSGKNVDYSRFNYFPLNSNNYIHNEPVIKVGDSVKSGQLLAEGWQTKNGTLALGKNVRVAYMPWKGYNFEDGVVISQDLADSLESEELKTQVIEIKKTEIGGPGEGDRVKTILLSRGRSPQELRNLDKNGVVKVGTKVKAGDILVGKVREVSPREQDSTFQILRAISPAVISYKDDSETVEGFISGEIIRVEVVPGRGDTKVTVNVTVRMRSKAKEGDKIAGRHGNKGIITKIEEDKDMPVAEDGKRIDLIYSPLAIPSRKNLGQIYEVHAGLIAEKTGGKPYVVYNFDKKEAENVIKKLKDIGYPEGKMTVINTENGKPFENKVTVGNMYVMKLKHKVDDKLQGRSTGRINTLYNVPAKQTGNVAGEKENPQTFGEMEMRALQAHMAVQNILEAETLKGDGAGDRANRTEILEHLATRDDVDPLGGTPGSLKVFSDYVRGMGLNMTPLQNGKQVQSLDDKFNALMLQPATTREIRRWSNGEVTKARLLVQSAKTLATGAEDKAEKGGLFDPNIFGTTDKERRTLWGHINLAMPVPNPVLMDSPYNPYAILTGVGQKDLNRLMNDRVVMITNPGDTGHQLNEIVSISDMENLRDSGKKFEYKFAGHAIEHLLSEVNIDKQLKDVTQALKTTKNPDALDSIYRKFRVLSNLKLRGLAPTDLMLKTLPILPAGIRPLRQNKETHTIMSDDANDLYRDLILTNNEFKDNAQAIQSGTWPEALRHDITSKMYTRVVNLFGMGAKKAMSRTGKELLGFKDRLAKKQGLIRRYMLSKPLDYSGRSVITVNPKLSLNEIDLPIEIAKDVYKPFIIRKILRNLKASNYYAATEKWQKFDQDAKQALMQVAKEHPVLLNRAPSLHKFSIQAFQPNIVESRSIGLNPLVVTGFNADFDGDQMAVHVPLTKKSIKEAKDLMFPSQNLINTTNGEIIVPLKNEIILGLYYLTKPVRENGPSVKSYTEYPSLLHDYRQGTVRTRDFVTLHGIKATVGQHLLNEQLPVSYRNYTRVIDKGSVEKLIREIIESKEKPGGPTLAVTVLDNLKNLGFESSTMAAISVSITDLPDMADKKKDIKETVESIKKGKDFEVAWRELQKKYLADKSLWNKVMTEDNPLRVMMFSGSKGNAEQIGKMSALLGLSRDITQKILPHAIPSSHKEGLSPDEFWVHSFDSRRGMADRSLSTAKPGALTRDVYNSTQGVLVTEADCGTEDGIYAPITADNKKIIAGRYIAKPVYSDGKAVYRHNTLVDDKIWDVLRHLKDVPGVYVRSPLTCKTRGGVCQKCYGRTASTLDLPLIGEPVGVLASQAIGEPTAQMTMKTFHGGGVGEAADVTMGFPRIIELMNMSSKDLVNPAITSPKAGKIKSIHEAPGNIAKIITIESAEGKTYQVPVPRAKAELPPGRGGIIVKPGDVVKPGDLLTGGDKDPYKILKYEGVKSVKNYVTESLHQVLKDSDVNIDRRHLEVAVSSLTNKARVTDNGSSTFIPGQVEETNVIDAWNAENASLPRLMDATNTHAIIGAVAAETIYDNRKEPIVREGQKITEDALGHILMMRRQRIKVFPKKIEYVPVIYGVKSNPFRQGTNWFSQLGFQNIKVPLGRAATGEVDMLTDPRGRTMAGKLLNIGSGYDPFRKEMAEKVKGTQHVKWTDLAG